MKTILLILFLTTLMFSCHTIYQPLYTESWSLSNSDSYKTYYLTTDPSSTSFFKNNIEKLEQEFLVEKILNQKGFTRVYDSSSASIKVIATFWSASPDDTIIQVKPIDVVIGKVPSKVTTTYQQNQTSQNNPQTSTNNNRNNSYNTQTRITYRNVYAFSGKYDTLTEIKRKIEHTFILSAYRITKAHDTLRSKEETMLWKSQVWLPYATEYKTIYSSSTYSQNSYLLEFSQLFGGLNRRRKYEFRKILPLMIAASYDLIEKSNARKKINFNDKFTGYQVLYPKQKKGK